MPTRLGRRRLPIRVACEHVLLLNYRQVIRRSRAWRRRLFDTGPNSPELNLASVSGWGAPEVAAWHCSHPSCIGVGNLVLNWGKLIEKRGRPHDSLRIEIDLPQRPGGFFRRRVFARRLLALWRRRINLNVPLRLLRSRNFPLRDGDLDVELDLVGDKVLGRQRLLVVLGHVYRSNLRSLA
jgi:hypothetical protein